MISFFFSELSLNSSGAKKETAVVKPSQSQNTHDDEEIEEDLDEFMNSSVSASEDFTKDETASEGGSLLGDYGEKLSWI